jgi:hypothetical protein
LYRWQLESKTEADPRGLFLDMVIYLVSLELEMIEVKSFVVAGNKDLSLGVEEAGNPQYLRRGHLLT